MDEYKDLIIVGGGCAGFGAAMYAGRFGLSTLIIADSVGGTIQLTDTVENYPGFTKITGAELAQKLQEHALDYPSVKLENDRVSAIEKTQSGFRVETQLGKKSYDAKTIIFATGTEWKKLGVPGEKEFSNKGVHYCAMCDGPLYNGKVLGVVGGSDSAAKEALLLTQWASKVYIIYRGEKIRPEPPNAVRVANNKKIEIINLANVKEIKGSKFTEKVVLDRQYNGSNELALDGLFVEIGHNALSQLAKGIGVETNEKGEIVIDRQSCTNVAGVYAAGDVVDTVFKQAITGVAEGVHAAYQAYMFLQQKPG